VHAMLLAQAAWHWARLSAKQKVKQASSDPKADPQSVSQAAVLVASLVAAEVAMSCDAETPNMPGRETKLFTLRTNITQSTVPQTLAHSEPLGHTEFSTGTMS